MGLVKLFYLNDLQPDYVCCRLTANGEKLRSEREAFVRFLKAEIKAYKIYRENPDEQIYKNMWTYFVEHNNHYPSFSEKYRVQL